jgi:hypothetical protein
MVRLGKATNRHFSMPQISAEDRQYYKSKIRSILAQDHQITQRALQERLKREGLEVDRKYLSRS